MAIHSGKIYRLKSIKVVLFSENQPTNQLTDLNSRDGYSTINCCCAGQVFVLPVAVLFEGPTVTCCCVAGSQSLSASFFC